MSVPVGPEALEHHIAGRPFAYVISTSGDKAHVIAIQVGLDGGRLDCSRVGASTRRNVERNPNVTVVFPPGPRTDDDYGSYSLVIDGSAVGSGEQLFVFVESAILHRPAG